MDVGSPGAQILRLAKVARNLNRYRPEQPN